MERRRLTGNQLAEDVGISATSISKIVTGQSRPRQVTLSRLMRRLCESREEEQLIIVAYETKETEELPVAPIFGDAANAEAQEERARRFMEVKAQSIAFKRSVARELDKAEIAYRQDCAEELIITDFLIEQSGKRIALECKFNLHRDIEKTVISARLILEKFCCDFVYIIVPFDDEGTTEKLSTEPCLGILPLQDLSEEIKIPRD
ncbi:helix-turn-helix domain-containing protein [Puniceicoccaceae bacterium K14]|nr:helix-turn-helix domain-containing protein [Puniceicoccaceae bacterium K14]